MTLYCFNGFNISSLAQHDSFSSLQAVQLSFGRAQAAGRE